jgi:GTP cyclohydrolase II
LSDPHKTALAIDALRRGWPIALAGADGTLALLPIETADPARLAAFDPGGVASILLSAGRAATLTLANQREAAAPDSPVLIERAPWLDFATATALADPQFDLQVPMKGPFRAHCLVERDAGAAALRLARIAGMLPAFFVLPGESAALVLTPGDIDAHDNAARICP